MFCKFFYKRQLKQLVIVLNVPPHADKEKAFKRKITYLNNYV